MSYHPVKVIGTDRPDAGATASADLYSKRMPGPAKSGRFSVHAEWDGTVNGVLRLYYSNKPNPAEGSTTDWVEDTTFSASDPAGSPGSTFVPAGNASCRWLMIMFDRTSGTGALSVWVHSGD